MEIWQCPGLSRGSPSGPCRRGTAAHGSRRRRRLSALFLRIRRFDTRRAVVSFYHASTQEPSVTRIREEKKQ